MSSTRVPLSKSPPPNTHTHPLSPTPMALAILIPLSQSGALQTLLQMRDASSFPVKQAPGSK